MLKKKMGVNKRYDMGLFHIEIENPRKTAKFKKAVQFKIQKPEVFQFSISGMEYAIRQFKSKKLKDQIFNELYEGQQLKVIHERKNKADEFACALYYKKKKIGYIPKAFNRHILDLAHKNKSFIFIIQKSVDYDEFQSDLRRPQVLALSY